MAYADIFEYPLTAEEIHRYLIGCQASLEEVSAQLRQDERLGRGGVYYTLPGRQALISLRQQREQAAASLWQPAQVWGKRLAGLPFVRMVAVTGSLAMNNVSRDQPADLDYLIVTAPGRLWSTRALVLLMVRMAARFGLNLCPNYLITTRAVEFPDHDLYTAHEVAQMVPLSGPDVYAEIRSRNSWVGEYLPNAVGSPVPPAALRRITTPWYLPLTESLLNTPFGAALEGWEMRRKVSKLSQQQADSPESRFNADVCKGHSSRHSARAQAAFAERMQELFTEVDV